VLTVAHRGASHDAPENTLAAIRRAVRDGADLVELDVQRTRDGALVVMHDTTLGRTTDAPRVFPGRAPWRVGDFTLDELRRLDAGSWWSGEHAGERVPTLAEAVRALRPAGVGLQLELKAPGIYPGVVRDLAATLRDLSAHDAAARAGWPLVVQSFDVAAMKEHKTLVPGVPVGLLGVPARENLPALATWADQVNPGHLSLRRAWLAHAHDLGLACLAWTVDSGPAMRRAIRLGVDGVITNRPLRLRRVLRRLGLHPTGWTPARHGHVGCLHGPDPEEQRTRQRAT
jgi:glycerophosphoryl diester phosphodiesterase